MISLCPKCANFELNSWINEKILCFKPEVLKEIRAELRAISLKPGECIVCNHNIVTDQWYDNILKIMKKFNVSQELEEDFKKSFGLELIEA
jgi:hypothetical protein